MGITATRFHDFSCGHRVVGHEGKCINLHGHNYRVHFECCGCGLDAVGRVIDFAVIKSRLCEWLEKNWDHRMLLWEADLMLPTLREVDPTVVALPFNPTAENMAQHLLLVVAPEQLALTGVLCTRVTVEETRKCSATAE